LLIAKAGLSVEAVTAEQAELAREAWRLYGKGRHSAGLNFGDCFSYALAKITGEPLLFIKEMTSITRTSRPLPTELASVRSGPCQIDSSA
jgi:uncharacterized protein with PIN domain